MCGISIAMTSGGGPARFVSAAKSCACCPTWSPWQAFWYGLEVVEVVKRLAHLPVAGIVVGPGDGVAFLQAAAREAGVEDRIVFTGWVDHELLPEYVNAIDICLSTQSNDLVGQV